MHLKKISFCLLIGFVLTAVACKKPQKSSVSAEETQGLPADFVQFYDKFHQDSAYQMAHIQFPLEGFPAQADEATVTAKAFRWTPEIWQMHRMEAFTDTLFTRQFEVIMPGMIAETIKQRNTPFALYRRFYKRGDDWTLIFYSDMNAMRTEGNEQ